MPHTITAKVNAAGVKTLWGAVRDVAHAPGVGSRDGLFMPSGWLYGGWLVWLLPLMRLVAGLASLAWLLPGRRREVRVTFFCRVLLDGGLRAAVVGQIPMLKFQHFCLAETAWC
ncbi:MAG: hypothetical protein K1X78_21090 [Verrucomicrobiaceae bacterium]|nr:hypothetical protein [Verrucomicrobiaceae bacterium]